MSIPRVLLGLALLAALAPAAAALNGPYAGVLTQGQTQTFTYSTMPPKGVACVETVTTYTVTLLYAPAGDALTLSVPNHGSASGPGASVGFVSGTCTTFTFSVTGTAVASEAAFDVEVTSGPALGPVATTP